MLHYNLLLKLQFCLKHSIRIMFQNIKTYEAVLCTIAALFSGAVAQRFSAESCSENFPKIDRETSPMVFFFSKVTCLTLQAISSGSLFFQRPSGELLLHYVFKPLGTFILDFLLSQSSHNLFEISFAFEAFFSCQFL